MITTNKQPISIQNDPWEAYNDIESYGHLALSNIEFTTTNLCNMRCSHCAVGYTLQTKDPESLPMDLIYRRLDEILIFALCPSQAANLCFLKIN